MANKEETCVFLDHLGETKTAKVQMKQYKKEAEAMPAMKVFEKRSAFPVLKILTVLLIVLWLLGLSIIREFQMNAIKTEINSLRFDLDDLKNKIIGDDILNQLTRFETEFHNDERAKTSWDNMVDDDDEDDSYMDSLDEDETDFLGKTMEARPKPKSHMEYDDDDEDDDDDDIFSTTDDEEFDKDSDENVQMKKVMRIPKADIEDESEILSRSKREIVAETPDGVPIMDEPYLVARAKNQSRVLPHPENIVELLKREHNSKELFSGWDNNQRNNHGGHNRKKSMKKYEEMDTSTVSSSQVFTRPSRVMMTSEVGPQPLRKFHVVRRPMLRSGPAGERDYTPSTTENRPRRRKKNRNGGRSRSEALRDIEMLEESPSIRPMAAHFNGDTSGYSVGGHEHFAGNGRLRHPHDVPYTAWTPAPWVSSMKMDENFKIEDGSVFIREPGLYFIYAQIYFLDPHDTNAFRVYKSNDNQDETLMQCTTMTHSPTTMDKANTCFTAGVFQLNSGDLVTIKNLGSLRYSIMEEGKSFFGFVKLGNMG